MDETPNVVLNGLSPEARYVFYVEINLSHQLMRFGSLRGDCNALLMLHLTLNNSSIYSC
jgi:hypothetical protein